MEEQGGIAGTGFDGYDINIYECVNVGTISSEYNAGGIVGLAGNNSDLKTCYNTGTITGKYVGGICGKSYNEILTIANCYNTGTLDGTSYTGGLVGWTCVYDADTPTISNSYSVGSYDLIDYTDTTDAGTGITGATITNSESNIDASDLKTDAMIEKLNNEIETDSYYVQDTQTINDGYPILSWQE